MKNNLDDEPNKEDLIQELILNVFEKAKNESKKNNSFGLSSHLSKTILREFNINISVQTFNRYYKSYILKEKDKNAPNEDTKDVFSKYLEYKNFKDFEVRREYEKIKNDLENKIIKMQKIGISSIIVLLIIASIFISKYYKKNCMIWVDDHYEKIRCSGLDMEDILDPVRLNKFKKVEVCKDSIFFKNGKPIKHYLRHNNEIEFFTYPGKHPVYEDKFLNEVTLRIKENYVKPCDSINKK